MRKLFIVTVVILGILIALQIRSFQKVDVLLSRSRPSDVLVELRTFQVANERLRTQLADKERQWNEQQLKIPRETLEEEIRRLRLLSGEVAVSGEGIEITLGKPVQEFWFSDLVATMVSAGAEAIAVNDIRLLPKTAGFREINDGLLMGSYFLLPPLRITAIGPSKELYQTVSQSGGILDRIQRMEPNISMFVTERGSLVIPPLSS